MAQFPIQPVLKDGYLVHLIDVVGQENAKPCPRPDAPVNAQGVPVWDPELRARTQHVEVYARLGIPTMFTGHAAVSHSMMVWEAQIGLWAYSEDPSAIVVSTFWGIGLRVALTFSAMESEANITPGAVAAHVEAEGMQVSYRIDAIGLGHRELASVLRGFPALGKFDINAYNKLEATRRKLITALTRRLSTADAVSLFQPTIVELSTAPIADTLSAAAERRLVMQSIAAGLSLGDTLKRINSHGAWLTARPAEVRRLYLAHTGDSETPTAEAKSSAASWLQT